MHKEYTSSFEDLLRQDKSVIVNHRNVQSMAIKLHYSKLSKVFPIQYYVTYFRRDY